jgi:6-phosphogluconolactonase (cycloisomerase 2 family)
MDINSTSTRVAITTAGGVTTYTKSPSGRLTPVAGAPFPTGGNYPSAVKFDRLNRFIFVINYQSNNVTVFRVGTTGALTKTAGSPYATGRAPSTVIVVK